MLSAYPKKKNFNRFSMIALLIQVMRKLFCFTFQFDLNSGENEKPPKEDSYGNEQNNIDDDCEENVKISSTPRESLIYQGI